MSHDMPWQSKLTGHESQIRMRFQPPIIKCQRCGVVIPIDKDLCGRCDKRLECLCRPWKICNSMLWLCIPCETIYQEQMETALSGFEEIAEKLKK